MGARQRRKAEAKRNSDHGSQQEEQVDQAELAEDDRWNGQLSYAED
jgi:hypothetical protein